MRHYNRIILNPVSDVFGADTEKIVRYLFYGKFKELQLWSTFLSIESTYSGSDFGPYFALTCGSNRVEGVATPALSLDPYLFL